MKIPVLKTVVFSVVFLISLVVFTFLTNRGNMDMTAKMSDATLPLIYLDVNEREVNCLVGYREEMEASYVQECITPLSLDRTLNFTVVKNGLDVKEIEYKLRSIDGHRLIENGVIAKVNSIKFKDLLEDSPLSLLTFISQDYL